MRLGKENKRVAPVDTEVEVPKQTTKVVARVVDHLVFVWPLFLRYMLTGVKSA